MIYCAHNVKEDVHAVVFAECMEEAGNIAADYWMAEVSDVVIMSFDAWMRESGLSIVDIV